MIEISWFYHSSTGDVTHVILRTRLLLFSRVVEKIGEPGDEANCSVYQSLCLLSRWPIAISGCSLENSPTELEF